MNNRSRAALRRKCQTKLVQAASILTQLGFGPRQSNRVASHVLLALVGLSPKKNWKDVSAPLFGITPIIEFVRDEYGVRYAPNTRETVRDEAVKYFVEAGLMVRNPDDASRPTTSAKTVYQVESSAMELLRTFGTAKWASGLNKYLASRRVLRQELARTRKLAQIPVTLPSGKKIRLSPGGQNPLIKSVVEKFCPRFVPGGVVAYIGDTEDKFRFLEKEYLLKLGIAFDSAAKMPDVVVHDRKRSWLLLVEALTSAGHVDGKRRMELKSLFRGFKTGLVFITAFTNRSDMARFVKDISWETEVWVSEDPDHIIHFNGVRYLGPYKDTVR